MSLAASPPTTPPARQVAATASPVATPASVGVATTFMALAAIAVVWGGDSRLDQAAVALVLGATALAAAVLVARVPSNPIGWLLAAVAIGPEVSEVGLVAAARLSAGTLADVVASVAHWITVPSLGAVTFVVLFFPTGREPTSRWRWLRRWLTASLVLATATTAFAPGEVRTIGIQNPYALQGTAGDVMATVATTADVLLALGAAVAVASLVFRWKRARGDERAQLRWFGLAIAVFLVTVLFAAVASGPVNELSWFLVLAGGASIPLAIGIAILEHHLWDIDRVIDRTLVYGGLSAAVILIYATTVTVVALAFDRALGVAASIVATVVVAVVVLPLRGWLQGRVDGLVYGQRQDPAGAIARLVRQLDAAPDPGAVPAQLVATVATAMKLPYVAVQTTAAEAPRHEYGRRTPEVEPLDRIEVAWQQEVVAHLLVAGGQHLRPRDRDLLEDLARHAGPALAAMRLAQDLEQSRQELVVAREEERRRLRGDLHDGIGPQLAGLAMGLDAIGNLVVSDPTAAREAVARLRGRAGEALATVRAVSRGLRPPLLDQLGLASALADHAESFATTGCRTDVEVRGAVTDLPAAVEVAVYHLAVEAMANAARHAAPTSITLRLERQPACLVLEVSDDGVGIPTPPPVGIGLRSMRARVSELRGSLDIVGSPGAGTTVRATLPLAAAAGEADA